MRRLSLLNLQTQNSGTLPIWPLSLRLDPCFRRRTDRKQRFISKKLDRLLKKLTITSEALDDTNVEDETNETATDDWSDWSDDSQDWVFG